MRTLRVVVRAIGERVFADCALTGGFICSDGFCLATWYCDYGVLSSLCQNGVSVRCVTSGSSLSLEGIGVSCFEVTVRAVRRQPGR